MPLRRFRVDFRYGSISAIELPDRHVRRIASRPDANDAITGMRQVVADVDDRARHSGGECILNKTPPPPVVASLMGQ
jgi:hypothetical protein